VRRAREVADGQAARALEGREQVFTGLQKNIAIRSLRSSKGCVFRAIRACLYPNVFLTPKHRTQNTS